MGVEDGEGRGRINREPRNAPKRQPPLPAVKPPSSPPPRSPPQAMELGREMRMLAELGPEQEERKERQRGTVLRSSAAGSAPTM